MKHLGLFFVALLGAVMPSMAWDATYQDPVSGIVYSYFYNDNVASVAAGTRPGGESDVFNQTLVFHNTIQSEAVILSSFEVNGKTYTVTAIDDYAFAYLTTLTQITIPKSVTRIGDMAFGECSALTDVYCYANPNKLKLSSYHFSHVTNFNPNGSTQFHVIAGYLDKYKEKFGDYFRVTFVGDLDGEVEPEVVSISSTFAAFDVFDVTEYDKKGFMRTMESTDRNWLTIVNPTTSIEATTLGTESCVAVGEGSTDFLQFRMTNSGGFRVSGHVKQVIIRVAGQLQMLDAAVTDNSTKYQDAHFYGGLYGDGFQDLTLFFDGTVEYEDATIELLFYGYSPIYIQSITIIQEMQDPPLPYGKCGDNLYYSLEWLPTTTIDPENSLTIQGIKLIITGTGAMYDYGYVYVDGMWQYVPTPWFDYMYNLVEADLSDGITYIGNSAFARTWNLLWTGLPKSLVEVGNEAFFNCMFTEELHLPEGLKRVHQDAFHSLNLVKNLYIPKSLTGIALGAFNNMYGLENYHVDPANLNYCDDGNCIIDKRFDAVVAGCKNSVIPDYVKVIEDNAFEGYSKDAITIPPSVEMLGRYAFGYSKLKEITLPGGLTFIGDDAFANCTSLLKIIIGPNVTTIGSEAFYRTTNLLDVFCSANPETLEWGTVNASVEARSFMPDKMTEFHVPQDFLAAWESQFSFLNVTFKGDLGDYVLPITQETVIQAESVQDADLTDNTIENVYYNLDENHYCGYSNGTLVVGQTTDMSLIGSGVPGSAEVRDNFNGIILQVGPGKGTITIDARVLGRQNKLAVRIGNGTPVYGAENERWEYFVSYNVDVPTYVYIYAVGAGSLANGHRAPEIGDDAILIYDITVAPETTGISSPRLTPEGEVTFSTEGVYDLNGQRLEALPTEKGIYIVNGRKVMIK